MENNQLELFNDYTTKALQLAYKSFPNPVKISPQIVAGLDDYKVDWIIQHRQNHDPSDKKFIRQLDLYISTMNWLVREGLLYTDSEYLSQDSGIEELTLKGVTLSLKALDTIGKRPVSLT